MRYKEENNMEYEDIFEKANELINCLGLVDSQDFIEYIISNVGSNGFCSSEGYQDFLNERY